MYAPTSASTTARESTILVTIKGRDVPELLWVERRASNGAGCEGRVRAAALHVRRRETSTRAWEFFSGRHVREKISTACERAQLYTTCTREDALEQGRVDLSLNPWGRGLPRRGGLTLASTSIFVRLAADMILVCPVVRRLGVGGGRLVCLRS